jgi:hypothetical protein
VRGPAATWDEVVRELAEPVTSSRIAPVAEHVAAYREFARTYEACETEALGRVPLADRR